MPLNKRNIFISIGLSFSWLLLLALLKSSSATLRPDLKDHISNIHSSILFGYRGMDVYKKSIQASSDGVIHASPGFLEKFHWRADEVIQLKEREGKEPLLIVWLGIPRPYPPGLWLILSPFAAVTEFLGRLAPAVVYSLVFLVLLCAHLSFFILWNTVRPYTGKLGSALIAIVLYDEIIGWSLCSQIDAIALLIFIWCLFSFKKNDFWTFFSRFSLASLVQFRVLFFLPMIFVKLGEGSLSSQIQALKNRSFIEKAGTLLCALGAAFSAYIFLLIIDSVRFESAFNNPLYYENWLGKWEGGQWVFLVFLALIVVWFLKLKNHLLLTLAFWWTLFFSSMPFVRGWYVLFLLPVLMLNAKKPWPAMALYAGFATTFFSSFPLDLWLPRMVLALIKANV